MFPRARGCLHFDSDDFGLGFDYDSDWAETSAPTQNRLPDASMNFANFIRNAAVNVSGPGHVSDRADVGEKEDDRLKIGVIVEPSARPGCRYE